MKKLLLLLSLACFLPHYKLTANCPKKFKSASSQHVIDFQNSAHDILQDPQVEWDVKLQHIIERDRQRFQDRCAKIEKALDVILPILACGLFMCFIGSGKN